MTPAFPQSVDANGNGGNVHGGITKREYAAIQIASGLSAKYVLNKPEDQDVLVKIAIQLADTLFEKL